MSGGRNMAIRGDEEAATLVTFSSTAGTLEYREGGKQTLSPGQIVFPRSGIRTRLAPK